MPRFHTVTCLLAAILTSTLASGDEPSRTVTVSAQSVVAVDPDEALLEFSVVSTSLEVLDAADKNRGVSQKALEAIRDLQIANEYVKVTNLGISDRYDGNGRFMHYEVRRDFEVRIHDFDRVETLVSALIDSGVTRFKRLKFQLRDQRETQQEARRLAFEYAKEKASHWAELSGLKLGDVIQVEEDVQYSRDTDGGGFGGFGGVVQAMPHELPSPALSQQNGSQPPDLTVKTSPVLYKPEEGAGASHTLAVPGRARINATVTVQFELHPVE
jgi:uncharacterized protein